MYFGVIDVTKLSRSVSLMLKKLIEVFSFDLNPYMSAFPLFVFLPRGKSYQHLIIVETLPSRALILRALESFQTGSSNESTCLFKNPRV